VNKIVYTLGTSTRSRDEFLSLLQEFGIQTVADVRRFPTSRFEHFKQARLADLLQKAGINYVYLGRKLGGYRPGGYEKYLATADFREGLKKLEEEARLSLTAVLCSERFPWRCHRRFIARELEKQGWQVIHIIDRERVWVPGKVNDQQSTANGQLRAEE